MFTERLNVCAYGKFQIVWKKVFSTRRDYSVFIQCEADDLIPSISKGSRGVEGVLFLNLPLTSLQFRCELL
jgi:hypothetical protein